MAVWKRFEEMDVWKKACQLTCGVYAVTREGAVARDFGFCDQIRRAAMSVASNIAEGFERGSDGQFVQMLWIAKGSCGELRTQFYIGKRLGYIDGDKMKELVAQAEDISRMIAGVIKHLKPS